MDQQDQTIDLDNDMTYKYMVDDQPELPSTNPIKVSRCAHKKQSKREHVIFSLLMIVLTLILCYILYKYANKHSTPFSYNPHFRAHFAH